MNCRPRDGLCTPLCSKCTGTRRSKRSYSDVSWEANSSALAEEHSMCRVQLGVPSLVGSYNYWLVLLSLVVAITASYVALDMTSRVVASRGHKSGPFWLAGGAAAMGCGIWSMHFIGKLLFRMPLPVSYDLPITGLSLL